MKKITSGRIPPAGSSPITEQDFRCRMTASLLAILTCLAVMASSAFALFHTEVSSASNTLQSAHYTVTATQSGDQYTLTASGTASTGYCIIDVGGTKYYTVQIDKNQSITLTIYAEAGADVKFTPHWGQRPATVQGQPVEPIEDYGTIGTPLNVTVSETESESEFESEPEGTSAP